MARNEIIAALGGRDFGELIPGDFLARFGLSKPSQYGMVCADVGAEITRLESLGTTDFFHAHMGAPGWTEYWENKGGEKKQVKVEMALGYTFADPAAREGAEQIELLGPGENTSFYTDAIPEGGALTLHHVCCNQNNIEELKALLPEAGYPLYLQGGVNIGLLSTYFAYFDTREELGFFLEIAQYRLLGKHRPPTESFISRLSRLQRRFS
jgi:hypothetical protein